MKRRQSHRKARNKSARQIVLGMTRAEHVHYKNLRAVLLPVRGGDHPKRYRAGQSLAVKAYVPGPTECRIILNEVQGPGDNLRLKDIDYAIARELGHVRVDTFQIDWVSEFDTDWYQGWEGDGAFTDACLRRFEKRWSDKLVWLLRFRLDQTAPPHLLAARSDELYVENPAMAMRGEFPALRPDEWKRHAGPESVFQQRAREGQQRAAREARDTRARLQWAKSTARAKGYDISREVRLYERHVADGKAEKAARQLELIEARVFPVAA